jgi:hypothetical protein
VFIPDFLIFRTYIRLHNKGNSIIITEGDHGYRLFSADLMAKYSLPNFSAVYFPDLVYSMLIDHLSAVHSFSVVMDKYFNQRLPILPDPGINERQ